MQFALQWETCQASKNTNNFNIPVTVICYVNNTHLKFRAITSIITVIDISFKIISVSIESRFDSVSICKRLLFNRSICRLSSPLQSTHTVYRLLSRCHCLNLWLFPLRWIPWGSRLEKKDSQNASFGPVKEQRIDLTYRETPLYLKSAILMMLQIDNSHPHLWVQTCWLVARYSIKSRSRLHANNIHRFDHDTLAQTKAGGWCIHNWQWRIYVACKWCMTKRYEYIYIYVANVHFQFSWYNQITKSELAKRARYVRASCKKRWLFLAFH